MMTFEEFLLNEVFGLKPGDLPPKPSKPEAPKNECGSSRENPLYIPMHPNYVKGVYVDEIEKIVTVVFYDGGREIVRCGENDEFDIAVGVALGVCRHLFGHTQFYKHIVKKKMSYTKRLAEAKINEYETYVNWCKINHKRIASETTFRKNKNKYLAKMKGEN